jgi:hypothetical protein
MWRGFIERLMGRAAQRTVTKHELKVKIQLPQDAARGEDREALAREIESAMARELAAGNDPAATKAALEEIAENHGGKITEFEDT